MLRRLALGALLPAELAARRTLREVGRYYRYRPHQRSHIHLDTTALPNMTPFVRVDVNRDGERGGPPPRPDENAFRALVVGGSAAECRFLDQPETWPAVAERILNEPKNLRRLGVTRAHIGNVARAIVPCRELGFMLGRIFPNYPRLDAIFVMVGASDLVHWMESGMPRTIAAEIPDPSSLFEEHPEGPWELTLKKTALFHAANSLTRGVRRPIWRTPNGGAWLHRVRGMRARAPHHIDVVPDVTPMLDSFDAHLRSLIATARSVAPRVILVRQAWLGLASSTEEQRLCWNFGIGRPYLDEVTTYFTSRVVDALMTRVDARACAIAADLGVEQVDLHRRLERSARTFYDELHFTPRGADSVGRSVADAVVAGHLDWRASSSQNSASARAVAISASSS